MCTSRVIAALFTRTRKWSQPNCPTEEQTMEKWLIAGILFNCEEKENDEIWRKVYEYVK